MRLVPFYLSILLLLLFPPAIAEDFSGRVVSVTDGDMIQVLNQGKAEKVRLYGIDTPEKKQAFGTRAKQFTSDLVFGRNVTVKTHEKDRYGRWIGDVYLADGKSLNHELVKAGLAWWYQRYAPKDKVLPTLKNDARQHRRGLWGDPNPVAPWDFRRSGTSTRTPIPTVQTTQTPAPIAATVYVTQTGKKYHSAGCQYLSKSQIPISLTQAKQSYGPCSRCSPPR